MALKYAQMINGKFAICPLCGKTMGDQVNGKGKKWACVLGCGLSFLEKDYPNIQAHIDMGDIYLKEISE